MTRRETKFIALGAASGNPLSFFFTVSYLSKREKLSLLFADLLHCHTQLIKKKKYCSRYAQVTKKKNSIVLGKVL